MATTDQLVRRNQRTTFAFLIIGGLMLGYMAALAYAFDTFDLEPRLERVVYIPSELR